MGISSGPSSHVALAVVVATVVDDMDVVEGTTGTELLGVSKVVVSPEVTEVDVSCSDCVKVDDAGIVSTEVAVEVVGEVPPTTVVSGIVLVLDDDDSSCVVVVVCDGAWVVGIWATLEELSTIDPVVVSVSVLVLVVSGRLVESVSSVEEVALVLLLAAVLLSGSVRLFAEKPT